MRDEGMEQHKRQGDAMTHLHGRLQDCEESIAGLIESNKKISETLTTLAANVGRIAEVLEAFNNAKGFWLTIKFVSAFAKTLLPILLFAGAVWVFLKTGNWSGE